MIRTVADRPLICVARKLPKPVEDRLAKTYHVRFNVEDRQLTADELLARAEGCEGLLITPADKMTADFLKRLPESIRIIATFSVGFDHVDLTAAKARGLAVTNTPDVLTNATADIALLLMLGAARGAYWGERMVREANWGAWSPTHPLGHDVSGKRLGILGMGRIGRAVARRAKGFDMDLHYHNRSDVPEADKLGARYHKRFEDMLPHCDFLSINCASTPQTRGLINDKTLALLPQGAIVVNTARGEIVDDGALIAALKSGHVAAAGLDVFRGEPNIDPRYRTLDNVFLLPHLGSATHNTRTAMGMRAVDNLDAFFRGERPRDLLTG
ncbi:MAG: D-glycerate dehydrogenase [Rhizobiales bacterium]|nr:D-glycerate dehydrogenase [Hyphomicrobiales bacterium]